MSLQLETIGSLVVHIDQTWQFDGGPVYGRSCTSMREVVIDGPHLKARSLWANGSYQNGPEMAEANVRVLFRSDDGVQLYLDYVARVHLPTHVQGHSPAILSGRFEVVDSNPKYAWLNRTSIAGHGMLDLRAKTQTYDAYVLRFDDDIGPRRGAVPFA